MAVQIKPTRMELSRLKKRLKTAVHGHKLLKDKRDEMVRQFMLVIRKNRKLRREVEKRLQQSNHAFLIAKAYMGPQEVTQALLTPAQGKSFTILKSNRTIMNVEVPSFSCPESQKALKLPYDFAMSSSALDSAVLELMSVIPLLAELAEVEKTASILADEIESTRRRVNALEFVVIPQSKETIWRITMKLEENERGALVRLMKSKELILQREQVQ